MKNEKRDIGKNVSGFFSGNMLVNLQELVDCATPEQRQAGEFWYSNARCQVEEMAEFYPGYTVEQITGVVAALSPNNHWDQNVQDAYNLIDAHWTEESIDSVKVCTYGANKKKGWAILDKIDTPQNIIKGDKVTAFFNNILNADCDESYEVTIDIWAARAAMGELGSKTKLNLSTPDYERVVDAYVSVAQDNGFSPKDLQAIVWVVIRDMTKGIRSKLEYSNPMFCPNCHKIGGHSFITV